MNVRSLSTAIIFSCPFVDGVHTRKREQDPLYRQYVAPVIEEIEINYSLDLSVEYLSRKVFITPQYLPDFSGGFSDAQPTSILLLFDQPGKRTAHHRYTSRSSGHLPSDRIF